MNNTSPPNPPHGAGPQAEHIPAAATHSRAELARAGQSVKQRQADYAGG
jgi:hypothetical protein